jgi:hypothetical protein
LSPDLLSDLDDASAVPLRVYRADAGWVRLLSSPLQFLGFPQKQFLTSQGL